MNPYRNEAKQLHREDGPAIEYPDGSKLWYYNGLLHRTNGPAIEYTNGYNEYWIHGVRHRIDGPAIDWANGREEWWVNGRLLKEDEIKMLKFTSGVKNEHI